MPVYGPASTPPAYTADPLEKLSVTHPALHEVDRQEIRALWAKLGLGSAGTQAAASAADDALLYVSGGETRWGQPSTLTLQNSSATVYALTLRNTNAFEGVLRVLDSAGAVAAAWNSQSLSVLGTGKLGVGVSLTSSDPYSLRVLKTSPSTGWIMQHNTLTVSSTTQTTDESAGSFFVRQLTTAQGGSDGADVAQARAGEFQILRTTGSFGSFQPLEVGVNASVGAARNNRGIHIYGAIAQWVGGQTQVPIDGIIFDSAGGFYDVMRAQRLDGQTAFFRVTGGQTSGDRQGDIAGTGDLYSFAIPGVGGTGLGGERVGIIDYTLAPVGETWAGLRYSSAQTAVMIGSLSSGGTGYGAVLLAPNVTGSKGAGVGVSTYAALGGAMFGVGGMIAALKATPGTNPASGYSGIYPGTDERWRRLTSGGTAKILAEEGSIHVSLADTTFGDLTGAGLAVSATTETDLTTNQTFTPQSAASVIQISWRGYIQLSQTSAAGGVTTRMRLDSAGANTLYRVGGDRVNAAAQFGNPLAGGDSIFITGLSAAAHTVKLTLYAEGAGTAHCRANGVEHLTLQITEHI